MIKENVLVLSWRKRYRPHSTFFLVHYWWRTCHSNQHWRLHRVRVTDAPLLRRETASVKELDEVTNPPPFFLLANKIFHNHKQNHTKQYIYKYIHTYVHTSTLLNTVWAIFYLLKAKTNLQVIPTHRQFPCCTTTLPPYIHPRDDPEREEPHHIYTQRHTQTTYTQTWLEHNSGEIT